MKKLWAPWRLQYVQKQQKGCIFCCKPKARSDEKEYILQRKTHCFSLLNIFPYTNAHLMVAPYRHLNSLTKFNDQELLECMQLVSDSEKMLKKLFKPDGFNVGFNEGKSAGAGFAGHIHFHIVPRWNGDVNFMPVIANAKVIPDSLENTYSILKEYIDKQ